MLVDKNILTSRLSSKPGKVLFVSHEASRSGAPAILLGLIKEFSRQSHIPFNILVMNDGPLLKDFQKIGKTYLWFNFTLQKLPFNVGWIGKMLWKSYINIRGSLILFKLKGTSVVFLNTIANGHIQKKLLFLNARHICYVHELEFAIRMITNEKTMRTLKENTCLFLAGSRAVKDNLVNRHGFAEHLIKIFYSSISIPLKRKSEYRQFNQDFRELHELTNDQVIIGVAGSTEWRKGFDMIFPLLSVYFSLFPNSNVRFIWKGFRPTPNDRQLEIFDIEKLGLRNKFILLQHGSDNLETLSTFDIHLLLSREDPFPLVMLEAATLGIPTVAFKDTGGCTEFIETDAGITVPYGNLHDLAKALNQLSENHLERYQMGKSAKQKVMLRHNQQNAAAELIEIIEKCKIDITPELLAEPELTFPKH